MIKERGLSIYSRYEWLSWTIQDSYKWQRHMKYMHAYMYMCTVYMHCFGGKNIWRMLLCMYACVHASLLQDLCHSMMSQCWKHLELTASAFSEIFMLGLDLRAAGLNFSSSHLHLGIFAFTCPSTWIPYFGVWVSTWWNNYGNLFFLFLYF